MKKTISVLCLLFISTTSANSIDPEFSIHCESLDKEWTIDLDGFRTGHPQGGITSYTGVMRTKASNSVDTHQAQFEFKNRRYVARGSSRVIEPKDFRIDFNPSVLSGTPDESAIFAYRFGSIGPMPPTEWETVNMNCELVERPEPKTNHEFQLKQQ